MRCAISRPDELAAHAVLTYDMQKSSPGAQFQLATITRLHAGTERSAVEALSSAQCSLNSCTTQCAGTDTQATMMHCIELLAQDREAAARTSELSNALIPLGRPSSDRGRTHVARYVSAQSRRACALMRNAL